MERYHLLRANCQTFVWEMIHRIRGNAVTYTKQTTRTSYAERFYHQVQITPLHTFILVAAFAASALLTYGFWSWSGPKDAQSSGLTITGWMFVFSRLPLFSSVVDGLYCDVGGHITIGSFFFVRDYAWKRQLMLFMIVVDLLGCLLQMLETMLPELSHQDMAPLKILMPVATFLSLRLVNRLVVSFKYMLEARVQFLRAQVPSEKDHRRRHSLCDSCDESETHDELDMRSSDIDHAIDSSDPVLALSERAIRRSTANRDSTARAEHSSTPSNANRSIGITRKPSQYEQPKKSQEQLLDFGNPLLPLVVCLIMLLRVMHYMVEKAFEKVIWQLVFAPLLVSLAHQMGKLVPCWHIKILVAAKLRQHGRPNRSGRPDHLAVAASTLLQFKRAGQHLKAIYHSIANYQLDSAQDNDEHLIEITHNSMRFEQRENAQAQERLCLTGNHCAEAIGVQPSREQALLVVWRRRDRKRRPVVF